MPVYGTAIAGRRPNPKMQQEFNARQAYVEGVEGNVVFE